MESIDTVFEFWFGELTDAETISKDTTSRWFKKDDAFDASIRERFESAMDLGEKGKLDGWTTTPKGALALTVLLDQFPRNAFRNTPRSFAYDAKARSVAKGAIAAGHDLEVLPIARVFFYLPLEHSENREDQAEAVERMNVVTAVSQGQVRKVLESWVEFATRHKDIIDRFGRFPHRNAIFGRESTPEEAAFLLEPRSSF